ncbi:MAG: alpha-L-rhamnosidase C-terminal domain-containing protein [Lacipirellulaceae bacterium]
MNHAPRTPKPGVLILALGLLFTAAPAGASPDKTEGWRAPWIGIGGDSKPNAWTCFRGRLELTAAPRAAEARIACDSKYWLWINGDLVVFEGQLKRGPTPRDTYFDRVDVTPHLKPGTNTIAVLVWHFGRHGFSHNSSGKSGLLFEADIDGKPFDSGADWKARTHPAFATTDPPLDNVRQPEANLRFDARNDIGHWQRSDYDDSAWGPPTVYGVPPVAPWNDLYERPIPQWKDSGLVAYTTVPRLPLTSTGEPVVGKLPYNCHVTPYLKVEAKGGEVITIATDVRERYGNLRQVETHRHEYVARAGVQEFELPAWINGHEVRYTAPAGVTFIDLRYRETGYDTEFVGSFECDDPRLNQLWKESARTLYVTMRDTYMDCPDRERAQWWGDAVNELGEAVYVFEPNKAPLLTKKAVYELTRWQRADGTLYSPVPSGVRNPSVEDPIDGSWDQELPPQMLASVGWYGFWTYYWNTGDRQTVIDAHPAVKRYLSLWELDTEGLVAHRPGGWDWSDWGQNIDVRVLDNAWYELALRGAVELARLAGDDVAITEYERRRASLKANFNRVLWNGKEYRSPDYKGATDDRAQAMAVVAGFAGDEQREGVLEVLRRERHASPYMEKYVLEALLQLDEPDLAFDRMTQRYAPMLEDDVTTLWELFDPITLEGFGDLGRGTYNHAWSGGPLTILSQYVAGVTPTSPAFATFGVAPNLGRLTRVDAVVPTLAGLIRVSARKGEAGSLSVTIDVPGGTVATVSMPAPEGVAVTIDDRPPPVAAPPVAAASAPANAASLHGPEFVERHGDRLTYRVPAGVWRFAAKTAISGAR